MEANKYKVPAKQWRKWHEEGRHVFNELYSSMRSQGIINSRGKLTREHWGVVRWNTAWTAADIVTAREKEMTRRVRALCG